MSRARMIVVASWVCVLAVTAGLAVGCGGESGSESAPRIDAIVPGSGHPGSMLTISGEMFGEEQNGSSVGFGIATADVEQWSDTAITVIVPRDARPGGDYRISVTTAEGTSEGVDFTVTEFGAPTPSPEPTGTPTPTSTPTPSSSPSYEIGPDEPTVQ